MTYRVIFRTDHKQTTTAGFKPVEGLGSINAIGSFATLTGIGLETGLEGMILEKKCEKTDECRDNAQYIVSVDVNGEWNQEKKEDIKKLCALDVESMGGHFAIEKYGSPEKYYQEIQRYLNEEFLKDFLQFLEIGAMAYSVQLLGGPVQSNNPLTSPDKRTVRCVRIMNGAQFYISPFEFSFKPNIDSFSQVPGVDILKEVRLSEMYTASDAKLWCNIMMKPLRDPLAFERLKKQLKKGPEDTSFTITNGFRSLATRFYNPQDKITLLMQDYANNESAYNKSKALISIVRNLKKRALFFKEPELFSNLDSILSEFPEIEKYLSFVSPTDTLCAIDGLY